MPTCDGYRPEVRRPGKHRSRDPMFSGVFVRAGTASVRARGDATPEDWRVLFRALGVREPSAVVCCSGHWIVREMPRVSVGG